MEGPLLSAMKNHNQMLIEFVTSRLYESSILPGRQAGINLPDSPLSLRLGSDLVLWSPERCAQRDQQKNIIIIIHIV